jgi:hypothetical protein
MSAARHCRIASEGVGEVFRALERQPALRQEAMANHGEAGQQDAISNAVR